MFHARSQLRRPDGRSRSAQGSSRAVGRLHPPRVGCTPFVLPDSATAAVARAARATGSSKPALGFAGVVPFSHAGVRFCSDWLPADGVNLPPGTPTHWVTFSSVFASAARADPRRLLGSAVSPAEAYCAMFPSTTTILRVQPHVQEGMMLVEYAFNHDIDGDASTSADTVDDSVGATDSMGVETLDAFVARDDVLVPALGGQAFPVGTRAHVRAKPSHTAAHASATPATPLGVVAYLGEQIDRSCSASRFVRWTSWLFGKPQAHPVWGKPFITDVAFDRPSSMLSIEVSGPDVQEEVLFAALRQYGRLVGLRTLPDTTKGAGTRRELANVGYTTVRAALAAKHGLHRAALGNSLLYTRYTNQITVRRCCSRRYLAVVWHVGCTDACAVDGAVGSGPAW